MQAEIVREWLSYKEAEQLVGLSRSTLWRLARDDKIRVCKVGRAARISRASLEAYMERQESGAIV